MPIISEDTSNQSAICTSAIIIWSRHYHIVRFGISVIIECMAFAPLTLRFLHNCIAYLELLVSDQSYNGSECMVIQSLQNTYYF